MKRCVPSLIPLVFAGLIAPGIARADLQTTITLQPNTAINLDTGAVSSSGGDLLWDGSNLTPQGAAKARTSGAKAISTFGSITLADVSSLAGSARGTAIAASALTSGVTLVVVTNGGNTTAGLVLDDTNGVLQLRFTTFNISAPAGTPEILQILNNSSVIPFGYSNYGVAPSSIFIVTGTNLADPGSPVLQSSANGLPTSLNNASIAVTVNGTTVHPALYYTSPTQLAAVLPAATPVGSGTLTITYKGVASAPSPIQVVSSSLGINTYAQNTAVATDAFSGAIFTLTASATPGELITLWTTGLGADPSDSDTTQIAAPHAIATPLQIYIGGVLAKVIYQGSSVYPGVDQINLYIPQNVAVGCWVSLIAVTNGNIPSNSTTLPIEANGGTCVDQYTGITGAQYSPDNNTTLRTGVVSLIQSTGSGSAGTTTSANGAFVKYTGLFNPTNPISPGSCLVSLAQLNLPSSVTFLSTGSLNVAEPNGTQVTLNGTGNYFKQLTAGAVPSTGGAFTFSGSGGNDVGPFSVTINFANPLLQWTNQASLAATSIAQGITYTWTGGNSSGYNYVTGAITSSSGVQGGFTCLVADSAGTFTVPPFVLYGVPPGKGGVGIQSDFVTPFTATGLDIADAYGEVSFSLATTLQ